MVGAAVAVRDVHHVLLAEGRVRDGVVADGVLLPARRAGLAARARRLPGESGYVAIHALGRADTDAARHWRHAGRSATIGGCLGLRHGHIDA